MVVILVALSIEGGEVDKWHINSCDGRVNQVKGRRSFVVKSRGGSGGLPIAEDVAIGSKSGLGLDAIVLERNEGRLG
ncbi:hypothetical protein GOBAR_AA02281 [Gossypium barbadense]|uniref:Uncharacterized protein n=1 Tax=Gossypium barbadense TaxID=3634 RepID=A0A2P5YRV0_GOSBA|nr:hypothetical protein GOBAR_AA02281 [Gossypium barbadense]